MKTKIEPITEFSGDADWISFIGKINELIAAHNETISESKLDKAIKDFKAPTETYSWWKATNKYKNECWEYGCFKHQDLTKNYCSNCGRKL